MNITLLQQTPVWLKIENYYVDTLELNNEAVKAYRLRLKENYDVPFRKYLETKESTFLTEITDRYAQNGKEIHDQYLDELSKILKRNPAVLSGDLTSLEETALLLERQHEEILSRERIQKKIYIVEYKFFSTTEYDCFEEFTSLEDIRIFLTQRDDIKEYRIRDWNQNTVAL